LWEQPLNDGSGFLVKVRKITRLLYVVVRDLADGQLTLRAMSLVYTTLLSLVPLLALSFSVLKGFGVHNQIEPLLKNVLLPLGEQGVEISQRIIEFVNNVKVGVLGSLGLFLLLYTVISLIQKIERAFNFTWHVSQTRPFAQRFSDYLSVIFVGPVLIFTAIGITASVSSASIVQELQTISVVGDIITYAGKAIPYLLVIAAFTFIYIFIPNTRVKFKSALIGAIIAGILWETTGWFFASFLVHSTKYTAIYSAFATLMLFLIWLYVSWIILLIGASIAFYFQNPEHIRAKKITYHISTRAKEYLTTQILLEICKRYYYLKEEVTFDELAKLTNVPSIILDKVIASLESGQFVIHTCEAPVRYYPAKPLDKINLYDLLQHVKNDGDEFHTNERIEHNNPEIARLFGVMDVAVEDTLKQNNFLQLVTECDKKYDN